MLAANGLASLAGKITTAHHASKLGRTVNVYESTDGPQATFVTVSTRVCGQSSFVPKAEADLRADTVVVPYDKALVKDVSRVDVDQDLTSQEQDRLYQHCNLTGAALAATAPAAASTRRNSTTGTPRPARGGDRDPVRHPAPWHPRRWDLRRRQGHRGRDTSVLTTDDAIPARRSACRSGSSV